MNKASHPPPAPRSVENLVTKEDLQATMLAFAQQISVMFQEALAAQAQAFQAANEAMLHSLTQALTESFKTFPSPPASFPETDDCAEQLAQNAKRQRRSSDSHSVSHTPLVSHPPLPMHISECHQSAILSSPTGSTSVGPPSDGSASTLLTKS